MMNVGPNAVFFMSWGCKNVDPLAYVFVLQQLKGKFQC
jgi:hypothetical protein